MSLWGEKTNQTMKCSAAAPSASKGKVSNLSAGLSGSIKRTRGGEDRVSVAKMPPWSWSPKPFKGSPLRITSVVSVWTICPPGPTVLEASDTERMREAEGQGSHGPHNSLGHRPWSGGGGDSDQGEGRHWQCWDKWIYPGWQLTTRTARQAHMPPPTQPCPRLSLHELLCSFFFCLLLSMVVRGLMGWELRGSVLEFWHGNPCAFMVGDEKLAATRAGETQERVRDVHRELQQWVHSLTVSPNTSWVWSSSSFPGLKTQGMFASHSLDTVQHILFPILLPQDKEPGAAQSPPLTRSASTDFEVTIILLLTICMAVWH